MFVDIDNQGICIGKTLLEYAMDKYKELTLAIYVDNIKSVNFYIHRVFQIVKDQINEDSKMREYIMKKLS